MDEQRDEQQHRRDKDQDQQREQLVFKPFDHESTVRQGTRRHGDNGLAGIIADTQAKKWK